jgi:predicted hotdog family 3-hydroxylacyl-ACP dehydratase
MQQKDITVEMLLPHRGRMKLIDKILSVDEQRAVTRSTVTDRWPFFNDGTVGNLVFIELVAQTAGISNNYAGITKLGDRYVPSGWLVGIKQARFRTDKVDINTQIITRAENAYAFESYREISGTVEINATVVGEIRLQVIQSDGD